MIRYQFTSDSYHFYFHHIYTDFTANNKIKKIHDVIYLSNSNLSWGGCEGFWTARGPGPEPTEWYGSSRRRGQYHFVGPCSGRGQSVSFHRARSFGFLLPLVCWTALEILSANWQVRGNRPRRDKMCLQRSLIDIRTYHPLQCGATKNKSNYSRLSLSQIPRDSEIIRNIRTSTY